MCLHVGPEVGAVGERLLTDGAQVRLVTSVGAQVALQQPRSREGLVAHRAFVAEIVRKHMHGQCRHGHVHLAANVALFGAVGVKGSVCLLVTAEVT